MVEREWTGTGLLSCGGSELAAVIGSTAPGSYTSSTAPQWYLHGLFA